MRALLLSVFLLFFSFTDATPITRLTQNTLQHLLHSPALRCYDKQANHKCQSGVEGTDFLRTSPAAYLDRVQDPPRMEISARTISNEFFIQQSCSDPAFINTKNSSDMLWTLGQFLTHELMLMTEDNRPDSLLPIPVPADDLVFAPSGITNLDFFRAQESSSFVPLRFMPRAHTNKNSFLLDLSAVYGGDPFRQRLLRSFRGGQLRTSPGSFLPFNNLTVHLENEEFGDYETVLTNDAASTQAFVGGDKRANENPALLIVHTLLVREHNRLATLIADADHASHRDDETIFQAAKALLIAEMQNIVFAEFLPESLGPWAPSMADLPPLKCGAGGVSYEFGGAAFRMFDSLVPCNFVLINASGANSMLSFGASLQNIPLLLQTKFDDFLRGLIGTKARELDRRIVDVLRNLNNPAIRRDLPATHEQRGRDLGLPSFSKMRTSYDLPKVQDWTDITQDPLVLERLEAIFGFNYTAVGPFLGMMLEDDLPGSQLGALATRILQREFQRLREIDSCWFQRTPHLFNLVKDVTLADIIQANSQIDLPPHTRVLNVPCSYS